MKKYTSPITAGLTSDNWEEKINLSSLSLDDMLDLLGDFKQMESMGKKLGGFMKEAVKSRMPEGETEYESPQWIVQLNERSRAGNLDEVLITEEMGEDWVEEHRKPPVEYTELRLNRKETT